MKLILTGATGFIGSEVLRQCLQNPLVTLITIITRRPIPDEFGSPKLRVVLCKQEFEWLEWGPDMMRWVDGHDACIWCLGTHPRSTTPSSYLQTTHTYTLTAATAFSPLATLSSKFRFIYLSTYLADVTERKWRPFDKISAYTKGRTEKDLFELAKNHPLQVQYELYTFRPGSVLNHLGEVTPGGFKGGLRGMVAPTVPVGYLARAMIDVAVNGYSDDGVNIFFENKEILALGYQAGERELEERGIGGIQREMGPVINNRIVKGRFGRRGIDEGIKM